MHRTFTPKLKTRCVSTWTRDSAFQYFSSTERATMLVRGPPPSPMDATIFSPSERVWLDLDIVLNRVSDVKPYFATKHDVRKSMNNVMESELRAAVGSTMDDFYIGPGSELCLKSGAAMPQEAVQVKMNKIHASFSDEVFQNVSIVADRLADCYNVSSKKQAMVPLESRPVSRMTYEWLRMSGLTLWTPKTAEPHLFPFRGAKTLTATLPNSIVMQTKRGQPVLIVEETSDIWAKPCNNAITKKRDIHIGQIFGAALCTMYHHFDKDTETPEFSSLPVIRMCEQHVNYLLMHAEKWQVHTMCLKKHLPVQFPRTFLVSDRLFPVDAPTRKDTWNLLRKEDRLQAQWRMAHFKQTRYDIK